MIDETLKSLLARADQYWKEGELEDAHQTYLVALQLSPGCWHAAFQLVWIEAAFGLPAQDPLPGLQRPRLPRDAAVWMTDLTDFLERLRGGQALALSGTLADWDIKVLKRSAQAREYDFWEECAERAARAMQYGLAYRCYQEAAMLKPNLYFDPPRKMRQAFTNTSEHLKLLRGVDEVEV